MADEKNCYIEICNADSNVLSKKIFIQDYRELNSHKKPCLNAGNFRNHISV